MFFTNKIKNYLKLFLIFTISSLSASEDWQYYWHEGVKLYSSQQYHEASPQFEIALNMMSNDEKDLFPFVMASKIENDFILQNYSLVLEETESILNSKKLTDYERLICGVRRISSFMKLGNEDAARQEYTKYVIGCPLFPAYHYTNNKIIIRNMLDCNWFKTSTKQFMLSHFCNSEKNIHEYGNLWIIDITKTSCSLEEREELIDKTNLTSKSASSSIPRRIHDRKRTPEQVEACCNTCDMLAVGATAICGCLSFPEVLAGPWTSVACTIACVGLVERMRQDCRTCCKMEPKTCWDSFETWKDRYRADCPNCHPSNL